MIFSYDDWVCQVYLDDNDKLAYKLNESWVEYLCQGKFEQLRDEHSDRIAKGGGQGKSKCSVTILGPV